MMNLRVLVVVCAVAIAHPAIAAVQDAPAPKTPPASKRAANPCHDDIQKFCKDVQPGGGRIMQCLTNNEAQLTQACRESRDKVKTRADQFQQACGDDIMKYCKDQQAGGGRVAQCLRSNQKNLSAACATELKQAKDQRSGNVQ